MAGKQGPLGDHILVTIRAFKETIRELVITELIGDLHFYARLSTSEHMHHARILREQTLYLMIETSI